MRFELIWTFIGIFIGIEVIVSATWMGVHPDIFMSSDLPSITIASTSLWIAGFFLPNKTWSHK